MNVRLPRVLSLFDLAILASASMGPAFSLATTMGPMVAAAGTLAPLALVLLTAVMACVAIGFARMLRVMPNAGSSYSWIRTAFGPRVGAYGAWLLILSNFFAVLATALPAGTYTLDLVAPQAGSSPLWIAAIGCGWIVAASLLLWAGLRPTASVAAAMLLAELGVLAVTAVAGFARAVPAAAPPGGQPSIGLGGIFLAMAIGIWMTDGWEISASASEESRGSRDEPGAGGLLGLLVTSALMLCCMIAYMRVGSIAGFSAHEEDALAYVGAQLGSGPWTAVIEVTVLVSILVSLQTTLVYLTRSVYAMGRDGVLPAFLGTLDARGTPTPSIAGVALCVIAFTLATGFSQSARDAYNLVLNGSAVFLGALFMCSSAAAVRTFAGDPAERLRGVVLPLAAALALAVILVVAVVQSDVPTRIFIVAGVLAGVPIAAWRSRIAAASFVADLEGA